MDSYVQFAPVPFSAVRLDVPPVIDEDGVDWQATAANMREAWDALTGAFEYIEEGPPDTSQEPQRPRKAAPRGNGRPAAPQRASGGSGRGRQDNPWPPNVVRTTTDEGEATVGCSWHNIKDENNNSRPRPMRVWDESTGEMKCTGKTEKPGNEEGYCPLRYFPAGAATTPAEPDIHPDDLPFHHPPSLDRW